MLPPFFNPQTAPPPSEMLAQSLSVPICSGVVACFTPATCPQHHRVPFFLMAQVPKPDVSKADVQSTSVPIWVGAITAPIPAPTAPVWSSPQHQRVPLARSAQATDRSFPT